MHCIELCYNNLLTNDHWFLTRRWNMSIWNAEG